MFKKPLNFLREVKTELSKVSWSTRQELIGSTAVVLSITSLTAMFIFIVDFLLSRLLTLLFK